MEPTIKGGGDTFAGRMEKAMKVKSMRKADLSRLTGISQQRIGQYLLGSYEPKASAIYTIAKALEVDFEWLIGQSKKGGRGAAVKVITKEDLKRAIFGSADVSDALLEEIKKTAKSLLKQSKKR